MEIEVVFHTDTAQVESYSDTEEINNEDSQESKRN